MDISEIGLPVMATSAVCWLKDKQGQQIKDEDGKEIGIEFWSIDSREGLKAQVAASRARAEMEERCKEMDEDDLIVERIQTTRQINIATAALMFKSVKGDLTISGEAITPDNIAGALERLPEYMVRQMIDFVSDPEKNYTAKP